MNNDLYELIKDKALPDALTSISQTLAIGRGTAKLIVEGTYPLKRNQIRMLQIVRKNKHQSVVIQNLLERIRYLESKLPPEERQQ